MTHIKTWRERANERGIGSCEARDEEINELRAALAQQGEPVCADCGIPAGDVHMSTCKSGKWPSRVSNGNTAAPQAHPSRDVTELVEALEKLARLGNGEHYGNSDGNMIARDALSKYKGAKL